MSGADLANLLTLGDSRRLEPWTSYNRVYIRVILGLYWGYIGIMEKKMETTGIIEIFRG